MIPSFLQAGRPRRPGRGLERLPRPTTATAMDEVAARALPGRRRDRRRRPAVDAGRLRPRRRGQAGRGDALPLHRPARGRRSRHRVRAMTVDERLAVMRAYVRRAGQPPPQAGRALERSVYRFDVLADYGAFRDLQRHRMLTIEWQHAQPPPRLHPARGVDAAGQRRPLRRGHGPLGRPATTPSPSRFPAQAPYAVSLAYKVRFVMQLNAREAMHLLELRTTPAGPSRLPAGRPGDAPAASPSRPATVPSPR